VGVSRGIATQYINLQQPWARQSSSAVGGLVRDTKKTYNI
jgi:hypothetical protein